MIVFTDVTLTLYYRIHVSLFNMIFATDVTLTLYYRVHDSFFNMIVVTDVTLTLGTIVSIARAMDTIVPSVKVTSVTTIILKNESWTR
jgi:hypothetical protein